MSSRRLIESRVTNDIVCLAPENAMWPAPANVYVVTEPRGRFSLIDTGCGDTETVDRLTESLSRLDLSPGGLTTLVISHAHPDHMGAAGRFVRACIKDGADPEVLIHEDDALQAQEPRRLTESYDIDLAVETYGDVPEVSDLMRFFDDFGCPMRRIDPTGTIREGDIVNLGRYSFEVIHTPGHSPGHISLYDASSGVLYGGDIVGDITAWYTPSSGGVTGYLESLDKVEKRSPRILMPSHGQIPDSPQGVIDNVRMRLLAREKKVLDILTGVRLSLRDLTDRMFQNEMVRFFPGTGITMSHVQRLAAQERVHVTNGLISLP
ncbi:MAG: MBL fold metallo-hydrolase [Deltaproteobacteria bacterium]|nr:MBL fold metallo-hydrolase [Candidatus Zymogenaceae bacterium]